MISFCMIPAPHFTCFTGVNVQILTLRTRIRWSEEAAQLYSEAEEALILGHASGLIRDSNATYIGLNYFKRVGPPGNWYSVDLLC